MYYFSLLYWYFLLTILSDISKDDENYAMLELENTLFDLQMKRSHTSFLTDYFKACVR